MVLFNYNSFLKIYILEKTNKFKLKEILPFVDFMPKERIKKFNRLILKEKKINCFLAHFLTLFALKQNGIKKSPIFSYGKFKKPLIKNLNIFFNLSHTKTTIALAICSRPVGVDIEQIKKIFLKLH